MKMKKRIMALVVALVMLLTAIPVQAATPIEVFVAKEWSTAKQPSLQDDYSLGSIKGTKKISISYSNKSIISISKRRSKWDKNVIELVPKVKKPGKTTVTVKVAGKKYKCKVTVRKYEQGIRSLKIGNITIPGSKLDKTDRIYIKYSKIANKKLKLTAKLKNGWEVSSVENKTKTPGPIIFGKTVKFTKGPGGYFQFMVYNGRAGKDALIRVYLTK